MIRRHKHYTHQELSAAYLLVAGVKPIDQGLPDPPTDQFKRSSVQVQVVQVPLVPVVVPPRNNLNHRSHPPPPPPQAQPETRKRMRRDSESQDASGGVVEDGKEKSERKRQREKQRRSELTNAFEDMHSFILRLDADDEVSGDPEGSSRKKSRRLSTSRTEGADGDGGMTTRVDLINRASTIMKRLHHENAELKQSLSRSGGRDKNEVMVMVPTLTPADDGAPPPLSGAASFRPPYLPPGFAPLPQQDHSQPPSMYGSAPSRYPPPAWGPYPGINGPPSGHYSGSERGHRLPPPPPMDHHDTRSIR